MKNQCNITAGSMRAYVVEERRIESPAISTIRFGLPDGSIPAFRPGQFINVYFPETGTPEGKAYSISSAPFEGPMAITVRAIGQFSKRICALSLGSALTASLPYGFFYSESTETNLILLAGGIGIAPFRSMIVDSLSKHPGRKIFLVYSSRTNADLIFREELDALQQKYPSFTAEYHVTREKPLHSSTVAGRMDAGAILSHLGGHRPGQEFMICGSIPFVSDLWKGLRAGGVPEEAICTEAFFSH